MSEKELTPEEMREKQHKRIVNTVTDVMKVSKVTGCPPEAVAIIMLLHGLNAQANFEGASLRTILIKLFGQKRKVVIPEPGPIVVH